MCNSECAHWHSKTAHPKRECGGRIEGMNTSPNPDDDRHFLERGEQAKLRPTTAAEQARAERRASIRREPLLPQAQGTGPTRRIK